MTTQPPADPRAPLYGLGEAVATDAADFIASVGPYVFALLLSVLMIGAVVRLIRLSA